MYLKRCAMVIYIQITPIVYLELDLFFPPSLDCIEDNFRSQPTISLEMPVPSQGHYGFHSFLVVD